MRLKLTQKYVNAFLNTDGGRLYFGIEHNGSIDGLLLNRKSRDIIRLRIDGVIPGESISNSIGCFPSSATGFSPQVDPHLYSIDFIPVFAQDKGSPTKRAAGLCCMVKCSGCYCRHTWSTTNKSQLEHKTNKRWHRRCTAQGTLATNRYCNEH